MRRCLALLFSFAGTLFCAGFEAGVARVKITPETSIWMSGYAARTHPSEGVLHDLWAKALAIKDAKGNRVVIVTTDVIGIPRPLAELIAGRLQKGYGLDRASLVLNSSHTHSGPVLRANLEQMYNLDSGQMERVRQYSARFVDAVVNAAGAALGKLEPVDLAYSEGRAEFAINRREPTANGYKIGVNPGGPQDLSVPVLRITGKDRKLRAVLFGYGCHNTTLGANIYQISGDYAGFAQIEFERAHPGATAMFLMLCGGDQNPNPRGTVEHAERYGKALAGEAARVAGGEMKSLRGPLRTAFQIVEPRFAPHTRETFESRLNDANATRAKTARAMLNAYDEGRPVRRIPYPVQAIRFGKDLTLVTLGGEVVVDYALRTKREFGAAKEPVIVAGYSNDVMCYIPSLRVLKEGGYEADESMIYYGQPGPFDENIEEVIFGGVRSVMKRVGRK
ncbi:MAG TPA: neutral/alkaline non-lysosomal ceramidase N-terminal domain-containing protein [Bryobacteraceae bacterium]|nr:neutral/alkaline non-lysosomal ceramidase N-terminal domain-containing protein [Bryobacteraceae bacterium]